MPSSLSPQPSDTKTQTPNNKHQNPNTKTQTPNNFTVHSSQLTLHLINSPSRGGRELYVSDLIVELQRAGVNNYVVGRKHSVVEEACLKEGIHFVNTSTRAKFSLIEVVRLALFIRKHKITTVYSHTRNDVFTGSLIKLFTPVKHVHGIYMGTGPKKDPIHRFIYGKVDALITSSQFSKDECERYLPVPEGAVKLVRYGRYTERYQLPPERREEIRNRMSTPADKIVVAVMSRIDSGKGVGIFAAALPLLDKETREKVEFWIMGEPTVKDTNPDGTPVWEEQAFKLYSELKAMAEDMPETLKLIPFQKDYISWLAGMDIFVLPTHNEMYSLSVIDAMMTGLPVIGTDAGGTTEQIGKNERGILVEPGSAGAIANAIKEFTANPATIKQKGDAARLWATSQHNFSKVVQYLKTSVLR